MLILRRVLKGKLEINTCLGIEYVLVLKTENKEEFENRTKLWSEKDLENLYGLVCFDNDAIMPLYSDSSYYIMTGDGQTFSNISKKQD